jgi:predicted MFS family arabinose efflux permease
VYIFAAPIAGKLADKLPQHHLLIVAVGLFIIMTGYILIGPTSVLDPIFPNQ